jgi:hypothetical protein
MYKLSFEKIGAGQIQIDEFVESFESDHSYWSVQEYEAQWRAAEQRIDQGLPAVFFTSISKPDTANFFRTWVCYPTDDQLIFHEWILFLDQLAEPFDIRDPHKHILPYEAEDEDGNQISEWRTSVSTE